MPSFLGVDSENAAHRIAVNWESRGQLHEGVYIPKRNTASDFNYLAGASLTIRVILKVWSCVF